MSSNSYLLTIACLISILPLIGQDIKLSKAHVNTFYHGKEYISTKEAATVFYSSIDSKIIIVIDFKNLKSGVDSLDSWLEDLKESKYIFTGQLTSTGELLELSQYNLKKMEIKGEAIFNSIKHHQHIEINLFEIFKDGVLYRSDQQEFYSRISALIHFSFLPKHFGINKKPNHLKKRISISISNAVINPIPYEGLDSILKQY